MFAWKLKLDGLLGFVHAEYYSNPVLGATEFTQDTRFQIPYPIFWGKEMVNNKGPFSLSIRSVWGFNTILERIAWEY